MTRIGIQKPERVSAADILREEGASAPVKPHFLQLVGVQLAAAVGGLSAVIIVALVAYWIFTVPPILVGSLPADPTKLREMIEIQKQLQEAHLEPMLKVFDSIVLKCLLPLLTSILGYIFGSQAVRAERK